VAQARRVREGLNAFVAASAALFAAGAAATLAWCASMPVICGTQPMAWQRMPGQDWPGAAASFTVMWAVMMVPMMLPSLAPALWRYRQTLARAGAAKWAGPVATAAAGYFFVWALLGLAVYPLGVLFFAAGSRVAVGVTVVAAGLVQFSAWKRRHLACCHEVACCDAPSCTPSAWLHGMHLGVQCALCCGNLMAIVVATGVMDLAAMGAVAAAITLERLAPAHERAAGGIGIVAVSAGLFLLARAAG
jgi:predicted metal-binding membrane protein